MPDVPAGKRKYRNPLSDYQDQILFFGLFILGGVAIWTLKALGFDQVTVTIVPLSLMVLYAVVAFVTKRFRIREDRVGDNIYYLGFLYTLVSLAYALYVYNPDGSGATEIITNFGIAIFTTIFGLAGRVLFNQMREDPVEYEREARHSLAEASMSLRSELADISIEMSIFKRKIVQITEEGVVDVSNIAKASMTENVERFSVTANEVIEKIHGAFSTFTDHSSRLNEIASKNVEALQSLFQRIEKIEASPELFAAKLDPVVKKFEEVADEAMRRNRAQTNDLKRVRDMVDTAIAAYEGLRKSISSSDKAVTQKLENFASGIDKILITAARFAETLDTTAVALSTEITASRNASAELTEGMATQKQAIAEIRSTVEADLDVIRRHREALAGLVTESRESVQALQTALVSLSRTMVEQLGGR